MASYQFLLIVKPRAVTNGLGYAIRKAVEFKFHERDFFVVSEATLRAPIETARLHYAEHLGKPHYERITQGLASSDITLMKCITSDPNVVSDMRTFVVDDIRRIFTEPGSPRHENVIHCSDSNESGDRECKLWFGDIFSYNGNNSIPL